jgi:hypothetical protein
MQISYDGNTLDNISRTTLIADPVQLSSKLQIYIHR